MPPQPGLFPPRPDATRAGRPRQVSSRFLAVPLTRPGGQVGIIPFGKTGRQPNKLAAIVNGTEMLDCAFSPFDPAVLATGMRGAAHPRIPSATRTWRGACR